MPPAPEPVVLYGASGYAVSLCDMLVHGLEPLAFQVVAYIDDFRGDRGELIGDAPVIGFETWQQRYRDIPCMIIVADPAGRRRLAARVAGAGGRFGTACRRLGAISPRISVGEGTIVGYPVYIGAYTTIGAHTQVMPMSVVGHDVMIGDYVTICSSASIAGYVVIEDDVFVGAGAVIVNGTPDRPVRIGRGARIAAGAVVTKALVAGARVAGNPARDIRRLAGERLATRRRG